MKLYLVATYGSRCEEGCSGHADGLERRIGEHVYPGELYDCLVFSFRLAANSSGTSFVEVLHGTRWEQQGELQELHAETCLELVPTWLQAFPTSPVNDVESSLCPGFLFPITFWRPSTCHQSCPPFRSFSAAMLESPSTSSLPGRSRIAWGACLMRLDRFRQNVRRHQRITDCPTARLHTFESPMSPTSSSSIYNRGSLLFTSVSTRFTMS